MPYKVVLQVRMLRKATETVLDTENTVDYKYNSGSEETTSFHFFFSAMGKKKQNI